MENSSNSNNCSHLPDEVDAMDAENQNLFDDWEDDRLNLNEKILRGVYANGFENPSPIQKKTIIPVIKKKDIIAQAQSGTGKTATFSISILP